MKKLMLLALFGLSALVAVDASARCCKPKCNTGCRERVIEQACEQPPCCLTAVKVPATRVKHISYSWECPTGCVEQPGQLGEVVEEKVVGY
jgi:hypothetical protein